MKINYAAIIGTGLGLLGGAAVGFYVTRKNDVKTFNEALESREKYFTEKYDKAIAKLHEYENMLETLEASNTKLLKILNNSNFKANSSSDEEPAEDTEKKETFKIEYDIDKDKLVLVDKETTEEEDDYEEKLAPNDEWPETAADEEIVHAEWVDNDDEDDDFEPWEGLDDVNVDESDDDSKYFDDDIFDEDDEADLLDPVNTRNRIKSYGITEDDEKIWRADKEPLHTGFRSQGEYEDYMKNRWYFYDESIPKKEINGVNVRIWTEEMIKKTGYVTRESYEYYTKLNKTYKRIPK